ncbi:PEP-CTERM sorting domain-containing protein [Actimicrobium sp. CCI2.3]|uniref:PEP-CTERM sorting domain-containing protein n=1 Tax=Actimicrobium sp. CCI2.3 TaxID=3048616 RepID=UPI002B24B016|nr:PEP-CTERM sorting domain-containing protein [Actimicrobium sp. CCI2.3]MEB0021003.1 PEP-CTERM sorting domain-containing protein [Actimicrobium sp. CCI2.3]
MKIASGRAVKWAAIALMVSASVPALAVSTQSSGAPEAMTFASVNEAGSFDYAVYASGGMFDYYTRHNMTDFYLPYFSDMGILHIDSGASWDYVIEEKNNLFGLGGGVLHFYDKWPDATAHDYGVAFFFQSAYDGVKGPFAQRLVNPVTAESILYFGDPLVPASPMMLAALASAVPEPGNLSLLLGGLALLGAMSLKRRSARVLIKRR